MWDDIVFVCVCILQFLKNVFVVLKVCWASLVLLFLLLCLFPRSILPHTFELLCGIVPRSWLGSLVPGPRLPLGQLALAPQIGCCQPGHGSVARSPESSEARGALPLSMRELELLSQDKAGWGVRLAYAVRAACQQMDVHRRLIALCMRGSGGQPVSSASPQRRVSCGFLSLVAVMHR